MPSSPFSVGKGKEKIGARDWAEGEVLSSSVSFPILIGPFNKYIPFSSPFLEIPGL